MKRRPLVHVEGVSNIELFYDLIFVYCVSVLTSLCHNLHGGFIDLGTWIVFVFSFLAVLQVWFYTTLLMNRYGDHSAVDSVCLFVNMFLLYFMASGIQVEWSETLFTFNLAWGLILVNLAVCWVIKRRIYDNLDEVDHRIMRGAILGLVVQAVLAIVAAYLPERPSEILSWVALLFGMAIWNSMRLSQVRPVRFGHISERCSLLVIAAFGETVVALSSYMNNVRMPFPVLVFALVVGLFLIYIFEYDNMTDREQVTNGVGYMNVTSWLVLVLGNLTVALEFMPDDNVAFLPKSVFLAVSLVLYLLMSFLLGRYNKPEFKPSPVFAMGRLGICGLIVAVALATQFDPMINVVCDTLAVYGAFLHEWLLYHKRIEGIES